MTIHIVQNFDIFTSGQWFISQLRNCSISLSFENPFVVNDVSTDKMPSYLNNYFSGLAGGIVVSSITCWVEQFASLQHLFQSDISHMNGL